MQMLVLSNYLVYTLPGDVHLSPQDPELSLVRMSTAKRHNEYVPTTVTRYVVPEPKTPPIPG